MQMAVTNKKNQLQPKKSESHGKLKKAAILVGLAISLFSIRSCLHEGPKKDGEPSTHGETISISAPPKLNLVQPDDFFKAPKIELLPQPAGKPQFILDLEKEMPYESMDCKMVEGETYDSFPLRVGKALEGIVRAADFVEELGRQKDTASLGKLVTHLDSLNLEWVEKGEYNNMGSVYFHQVAGYLNNPENSRQGGFLPERECFDNIQVAQFFVGKARTVLAGLLLEDSGNAKTVFANLPPLQVRMLSREALYSMLGTVERNPAHGSEIIRSAGEIFSSLPGSEREVWLSGLAGFTSKEQLESLPISVIEEIRMASIDPAFKDRILASATAFK